MTLIKLAFRNIGARPGRFLLTSLAVLIGVALTGAVFIFTDSLRDTFGDLSQDIESGYDLAVRSEIPFGERQNAAPVPVGTVDAIAAIDGVARVQPRVIEFGIIPNDADGEAITANGPPNIGVSWDAQYPDPTLFLADGREPQGPTEFGLDVDTAGDNGFVIGDTYTVQAPTGAREMTLSGTFSFASADGNALVGAILTGFDLPTAVDILNSGAGYDDITVSLATDADPTAVSAAITAILPDGLEVLDRQVLVDEQQGEFNEFIDIFRTILLVFAFVILLVAAFIIYNVFSIVVGQRIQEIGLLRALGATGTQITRSIAAEALLVGVFATVTGVLAGLPIAYGLQKLLAALDFGPDDASTPLRATTIVVGAILGVGLTLAAAIWPALKARKVSPMAALRDGYAPDDEHARHPLLGGLLTALGVVLVVIGFASDNYLMLLVLTVVAGISLHVGVNRIDPRFGRFALVGLAAVLIAVALTADLRASMLLALLGASALTSFLGMNVLSPSFATPVARLIGAPIGKLGIPGRLARENAGRNPQRTATAASALMIGLALVTTVAVVGASLKATFADTLKNAVTADWIVLGESGGPDAVGFSPTLAERIAGLPEVDDVLAVQWNIDAFRTTSDNDVRTAYSTQLERIGNHFDIGVREFDESLLDPTAVIIDTDAADDLDATVGSTIEIELVDQSKVDLTVAGIYDDTAIFDSGWILDSRFWARTDLVAPQDLYVTVVAADGVDQETVRAALEATTAAYPQLDVRTKAEFQADQEDQINQTLAVVNVLLFVSILLAVLGVAITLALSVFERTREIGLTRAVGATRRQVKRMVRGEGIIVALFGGILGVALGLVFGAACVQIIPDEFVDTMAIPWGSLIGYLVVAGVAGMIAAYFPARRASKLNVLDAISHE